MVVPLQHGLDVALGSWKIYLSEKQGAIRGRCALAPPQNMRAPGVVIRERVSKRIVGAQVAAE